MKREFRLVDISKPKQSYKIYENFYWLCINDITQALFYGSTPQCNREEKICEILKTRNLYLETEDKFKGELNIIHVPFAYFYDERNFY